MHTTAGFALICLNVRLPEFLFSINCAVEQPPQRQTLWTQHRQLDYANNSVGSERPSTTRIVGITFTFTAPLDSCSMTTSTGASNSY
jgi:hypothetical protein